MTRTRRRKLLWIGLMLGACAPSTPPLDAPGGLDETGHPAAPEVLDVAHRFPAACYKHGTPCELDLVPLVYGLLVEPDANGIDYPFANDWYPGGCMFEETEVARVRFCARCRVAKAAAPDPDVLDEQDFVGGFTGAGPVLSLSLAPAGTYTCVMQEGAAARTSEGRWRFDGAYDVVRFRPRSEDAGLAFSLGDAGASIEPGGLILSCLGDAHWLRREVR